MRILVLAAALGCAIGTPVTAQTEADAPFRAYDEGRYADAMQAAEQALSRDPENPVWWALAAESRARLLQYQGAAGAFAQAARYESDPQKRSYYLRAQILNLVEAGMRAEARSVLRDAVSDNALQARKSLDWALVAIAAGDDALAQEILADESLHEGLTRQRALDAGYSAKRRGLDRRAVRFFERGLALDASETQPMSPAERLAIRRENRELGRSWSILAQEAYSSAGRAAGFASGQPADDETLQFGAEAAHRIGGWRNGKPVNVFARVFHSEFLSDDALVKSSTQGWVGIRAKPLASVNLNLEASRLVAISDSALDDWSLRAAISGGRGLEPELSERRWLYAHYYGDVSYLTDAQVTFGLVETRAGYSVLLDKEQTVVTPYAIARFDLDTGRAQEKAAGAGFGLSLRYWFDESDTAAYRAFIEFDLQARQRLAGDERASGILATMTIGR